MNPLDFFWHAPDIFGSKAELEVITLAVYNTVVKMCIFPHALAALFRSTFVDLHFLLNDTLYLFAWNYLRYIINYKGKWTMHNVVYFHS